MELLEQIEMLGRQDARDAESAGCEMGPCHDITEDAIQAIRDVLRQAGDERAEMASIGYRAEGRDLMRAYASGWDEVACA